MTFLQGFIQALGINTVLPIIESVLLSQAATLGETGLERAVTMPESAVRAVCAKSGADVATALHLRNVAAQALAAFIEYTATGVVPAHLVVLAPDVTASVASQVPKGPSVSTLIGAPVPLSPVATDQPDLPADLRH